MTKRTRPGPSPTRAAAVGAGGIVVVLAVLVVGSSLSGRASRARQERTAAKSHSAQTWDAKAAAAIGPLARVLPQIANQVGRWRSGQMAGAELRPQLSDAGRVFAAAAAAVDRLPASPAGPNVNRLYGESVALDRAWIDLTVAALDMPPGPLAQQVARAGARSRELADRVFDRGRALLVPVLPTTTVPGIEVVLPPDVPDWVAEGLAPGPPLDDPPPSPAATPLVRVAHRPQQSVPSWLRAVAASGAPSLADLDRALAAADASTLQSLSRRWQSAVDRMRAQPDPRGDRERADRLYLQWLVAAEAARVGQASRVIGGDLGSRLNELAIRLAGVARRA